MPQLRWLIASAALAQTATLWPRQPVYARHAMVVTRELHATDAGLAVLQKGGNAVDAAVAVGFALAVTHPSAGNIGGGGFMLIRFADGNATFIDFRERAPGKASPDMYLVPSRHRPEAAVDSNARRRRGGSRIGYLASAVPGTVRGLEFAHKKYGRKPWAELVDPAVQLARNGFPLSFAEARSLRSNCDLLSRFPASKQIFLRDGNYYEADDLFRQPDLARTLERVRDQGSKDFYEGETARLLAADMEAHGGLITLDDLKNYTAVERQPLVGRYRGYDITTAPPPSSGGIGLLEMLGVLEDSGYEKTGAGSAATLHFLAETMRRYFADRAEFLGDPDFSPNPVSRLLDRNYIAQLRRSIDPAHATPSKLVRAGQPLSRESSETTHYSIVDSEGNVVAVTYTLNGSYGSGVTASGLGFLLNNEMDDFAAQPGKPNMFGLVQGEANSIQPRKRPLSSMTPTILTRDGRFFMALGSPGGPTIINTVLQVILNVLDFGMNIADAVDRPRIHHQWLPDELRMESGFSPDTIALLRARGHRVRFTNSMGEVAAIFWDGIWLQGAADPRVEGLARGY